jgi:TonB family protein
MLSPATMPDAHFPVTQYPVVSMRQAQPFEPEQPAFLGSTATVSSTAGLGLAKPEPVRPVSTSQPRYPWWARAKGVEGFVELAFSVDREGKATNITVVDSIPSGAFDRAAQKALKKWKFEQPASGETDSRLTQVFNFKLENETVPKRLSRDCRTTGHRVCSQLPNGAIIVYVNPPIPKEIAAKIN